MTLAEKIHDEKQAADIKAEGFYENFREDFRRQARNKLMEIIVTSGKTTSWIQTAMELVQTCYDGSFPEDAEIEFTED